MEGKRRTTTKRCEEKKNYCEEKEDDDEMIEHNKHTYSSPVKNGEAANKNKSTPDVVEHIAKKIKKNIVKKEVEQREPIKLLNKKVDRIENNNNNNSSTKSSESPIMITIPLVKNLNLEKTEKRCLRSENVSRTNIDKYYNLFQNSENVMRPIKNNRGRKSPSKGSDIIDINKISHSTSPLNVVSSIAMSIQEDNEE